MGLNLPYLKGLLDRHMGVPAQERFGKQGTQTQYDKGYYAQEDYDKFESMMATKQQRNEEVEL